MASKAITVNRAPVLTLWAAIPAATKGWDAAGTLDRGLIERLAK
jgi:hypothetical protein